MRALLALSLLVALVARGTSSLPPSVSNDQLSYEFHATPEDNNDDEMSHPHYRQHSTDDHLQDYTIGTVMPSAQWFRDQKTGRVVLFRGVNLGGNTKLPKNPPMPSHRLDGFFDHRHVSFVGRPFTLKDADEHFSRLHYWGYNIVRLLVPWEAIEHEGPGLYDFAYMEYVVELLKVARRYQFKVFLDPHQDVWSRFTGGSGAPGWTLEVSGLDMKAFQATGAAIVHNQYDPRRPFPKMIWPTNYNKLAAATMFTLFFGGDRYAPGVQVDGVPIQDFLQQHYIDSYVTLTRFIMDADPTLWGNVVMGFDTMNEPSGGLIGYEDLRKLLPLAVKNGPTPTFAESMRLCLGLPTLVRIYYLGNLGMYVNGRMRIDPKGAQCFLPGRNIWVQMGIMDTSGNLLRPHYFQTAHPQSWMQDHWLPFVRRMAAAIRAYQPDAIMFAEGMAMEMPPKYPNAVHEGVVYAPHMYDGLTLLQKRFNNWNINGVAVIKGENPLKQLAIGYAQVKEVMAVALRVMKEDGLRQFGLVPMLVGEIGIPFDMHNKAAFRTGDYSQQWKAMEANMAALDRNLLSYTVWNYNPENTHEHGDGWNGEDLSVIHYVPNCPKTDPICHGRTLEALIRPYPKVIHGQPISIDYDSFDTTKTFTFQFFVPDPCVQERPEELTEIFVPYFVYADRFMIRASKEMTFRHESRQQTVFVCAREPGLQTIVISLEPKAETQISPRRRSLLFFRS